MTQSKGIVNEKFVTDSIMIALFPVLAYLFTYTFEIGYAKYFKVPIEFVEIDLMTTLKYVSILAMPALLVLLVFNMFMFLFHDVDTPIINEFKYRGPFYIYSIAIIIVSLRVKEILIPSISVFLILNAIHFLTPLLSQKGKGPYSEKLKIQSKNDRKEFCLNSYMGKYAGLLFVVMLLGSFLSYQCGTASAMGKEVFQTVGNQNTILICKYGERIICAEYNDKDSTISNKLVVMNISEIENLVLETRDIGRLKVKNN